jgi:hypothetical protein
MPGGVAAPPMTPPGSCGYPNAEAVDVRDHVSGCSLPFTGAAERGPATQSSGEAGINPYISRDAESRSDDFHGRIGSQDRGLNSIETEALTRLKVIDRLLVNVLHWPYVEISTEAATENGFADYVCKVQGRSRLVSRRNVTGTLWAVKGVRPALLSSCPGASSRLPPQRKVSGRPSRTVVRRTPNSPASRTAASGSSSEARAWVTA